MEKTIPDKRKIFLVFNTVGFGDILLCNSLCQNIKHIFPDSLVVFITNKKYQDAARFQEGVDDVILYDSFDGNYGDEEIAKFTDNFKYKDIYAAIITYRFKQHYDIAKSLNCKHIYMEDGNLFESAVSVQELFNNLLSPLAKTQIKNYPIKFNIPNDVLNPIENKLNHKEKYITLCCVSMKNSKDMPVDTTVELIRQLNKVGYKVVFSGAGEESYRYSKQLVSSNVDFINIVNETSLLELGKVIMESECLISVDTGTMHLGYALGVPTVCVFYENTNIMRLYSPNKNLYNKTKVLHIPDVNKIKEEAICLCK